MPVPCSSDELYSYLTHCRPDLCILEGRGEEEGVTADRDDEEFVLIEDKEEVEEEVEEEEGEEVHYRYPSSGEDWEVSGLESYSKTEGVKHVSAMLKESCSDLFWCRWC